MSAETRSPESFSFAALPVAFGLAIAFAICQLVLFVASGFVVRALESALGYHGLWYDIFGIFWVTFVWAHALFVLMVTDAARPKQRPPRAFSTMLVASIPLAALFLIFSVLDVTGAAHGCGDGRVFRHNDAIPFLPWLWIGWLALTAFAAPARLLAWLRKAQFRIMPAWQRLILLALGAAPVWLFGYVFQNRTLECGPQEMWGLMEGGMIAFPLLGVFLFTACTSMAMLSAAFVQPSTR